jgi:NitT/TauT family transport system permease protein
MPQHRTAMKGNQGSTEWFRRFFKGWFDYQSPLAFAAKVTLMLAGLTMFLLAWQFAPRTENFTNLLPTATQVFSTTVGLFSEKDFALDVLASLQRIGISFLIAAAIALPLGIAMGAFPAVEGLLNPLVSPLRYLPAPSFIPLLLALLGTGNEQKIALLVIGVVWFLISLLMDDTKRVPKDLVEVSRTLGAGRLQAIHSVIIPAALPFFLDTMRQMLAVSWTYLVIAEIVASTDGIGAVMMRARRVVRMDVILSCILMIGVLGFISDAFIRFLRWLAFPHLRNNH